VSEITPWQVKAALRDLKNGTPTGNDHINVQTLNAVEKNISKTLAKLYTKCLLERRIYTVWKNAKLVVTRKNGTKLRHQELHNNTMYLLSTYITFSEKY